MAQGMSYRLRGPTCLSFSGGRTSAYMLRQVLNNNTAADLAENLVVCFANTGKEAEATLRFVHECGQRWGVLIHWIEYDPDAGGFEFVNFETAHRLGEPFRRLIERRGYLPNPVTRFCTSELKIRPMHKALKALRPEWTDWDQFIGIRADEPRRVAKIRARGRSTESKHETMCMPMAEAGEGLQDVARFWDSQPFGLELQTERGRTLLGNCDLCFLKPLGQRLSIITAEPQRAVWWAAMETKIKATFRKDEPSYSAVLGFSQAQRDLFAEADESEGLPCFCGE